MSDRLKEILDFLMDLEPADFRDASLVREELEDMGYTRLEIRQAFRMLDFGADAVDRSPASDPQKGSRVLSDYEKHTLSVPAQGYLLRCRGLGWISEMQLCAIIDNAAFECVPPVSLEEVRELASRFVPDLPRDIPSEEARRDGQVH